ncbi:3-dehydroquinate synthase [Candidatus Uabimicrobium sp. HlEnr_7]|uniref:3-dehydroquinate synthase n=1 Tax=Candidatus Uabimicrobium helgolandensis TaxID=3095367 RepID=UPI0035578D33
MVSSQVVSVSISEETPKKYNVFISDISIFEDTKIIELFSKKRIMLIADEKAFGHHKDTLPEYLKKDAVYVVHDAEKSKNLGEIERITQWALDHNFDRGALVVSFGGGAVGDLAGFFASVYMRGVAFIQIPTTLLAQVDASVGGKTAVNACGAKNLIGSFYQPQAVIINSSFLQTLPTRELYSGMAEVIKMGVIGDEKLFSISESVWGKDGFEPFVRINEIVELCVRLKMKIVADDERDLGNRMWLNLGHTTAHAIESVTNYSCYLHGEAVAFGCIVAAHFALKLGICDEETTKDIERTFANVIQSCSFRDLSTNSIIEAMKYDKKRDGVGIRFIAPQQIGKVTILNNADVDLLHEVITEAIKRY